MKPHVHFELGENRASIHFLQHLIDRRNWQFNFLPLNCLVGMPHVDAYMHIILVWLRSYHSGADSGCSAWNLLNDVKVKKLVNLCPNFIFQRVRDPPRFLCYWCNFAIDGQLELIPAQRGSQIGFSGPGISLTWSSGFGIWKQNRDEFGDWKYAWEVGYQKWPSGLRDCRKMLGRDYRIEEPCWYHCLWNKLSSYSPVLVQLSALIAF